MIDRDEPRPPTTVAAALERATTRLEGSGVEEPRLNAELLLSCLLGCDRGGLFVRRPDILAEDVLGPFESAVVRRANREPLQYITGFQEFHGVDIAVDSRVLIPRPETEGLVDAVLSLELPGEARVLDLGTGSGCIPIALGVKRPGWRLSALEASADTRAAAESNVARVDRDHPGLLKRVEVVGGDFARPPAEWRGAFDAVVSNPPYVTELEWHGLEPEVRDWEPKQALVPGPSGLEAYEALIPAAARLLRPGGFLLLEIGYGQADPVRKIATEAGYEEIAVQDDLRGIPRVVIARSPAA
ncbi:hypothetical protein ABI59_05815 [Acidobacteria bacterium Mor1]|nr:hypothetical protein ABI59_05815 [Acidobacteria bacterium Mor1]